MPVSTTEESHRSEARTARVSAEAVAGGPGTGLLEPRLLWTSLPGAVRKLDPRGLAHNPVMFIVEVGALLTTVLAVRHSGVFSWSITVWLWVTVLFANLAEAVAEGRGKAQAAALRRAKQDSVARRLTAVAARGICRTRRGGVGAGRCAYGR